MRKFAMLLVVAGFIAVPALAFALAGSCNHMCPAAKSAYSVGYEAVTQLSLATVSEGELE